MSGSLGGGIYQGANGILMLHECKVSDGTAHAGGGIYNDSGSVTLLEQCSANGNTATFAGGGIYYGNDNISRMDGCEVIENTAVANGGGIAYESYNLVIIADCNVNENTAVNGAGLYFDSHCSGTLDATELVNNSADDSGGAIYIIDSDALSVTNCNVLENSARLGGGLYCAYCPEMTVSGCAIKHNEVFGVIVTYQYFEPDPNDANVPLNPEGPLDQSDPSFDANDPNLIRIRYEDRTAIALGGGIYSWVGPEHIKDCEISYNRATGSGGGIYLVGDDYLGQTVNKLENCLINGNTSGRDGAGVSCNWYSDLLVSDCTIADNKTTRLPAYGGGLYVSYRSNAEVINSVIWGNKGNGGSQIVVGSGNPGYSLSSTVKVSYSNIEVFQPVLEANEIPKPIDPSLIGPNSPDYFIYSVLNTADFNEYEGYGAHGLDGWVGDDDVTRIICNDNVYSADYMTVTSNAYIFTVTIPEGEDPQTHEENPYNPGPMAPRTFELERYFDLGAEHYIPVSACAFIVDPEENVIYLGVTGDGILKYVFDEDANNPVADGPKGNYVFDSIVAPPCQGWPDTLAWDPVNNIWYAGDWSWNIYSYDGSQGANGQWELAFTSFPYDPKAGRLSHHDGLAFANGHLFLTDMYGDWVLQYTPDGVLVNAFYHEPLGRDVEGMGFGAFNHFWTGSFNSLVTEIGGGVLQLGIDIIPDTPPIYVESGSTLTGWDPNDAEDFLTWDVNAWDPNLHNIDDDPCFTHGYYLSQIDAGQHYQSPCVDAGSGPASDFGLDVRTTRTTGINDVNVVDMGYHYSEGVAQYDLTVNVIGGGGTVDPNSGSYNDGDIVHLTATPDANYFVEGWYDDANDALVSIFKTVDIVMNSDRSLSVRFKLSNRVRVGGSENALADAVAAAGNGDILRVDAGTYNGDIDIEGKEIKLFSLNPDDPCVVAATIIDCGSNTRAFLLDNGEGPGTVINGFKIINGSVDGQSGGAIFVGAGSSPKLANLIISDCKSTVRGGAIYVGANSSPRILHVTINNCSANSSGGGIYVGAGSSPVIENSTFSNCSVSGGPGGAIYYARSTTVELTACTFTNNSATSGGAVYYNSNSVSSVTDCRFVGNSSDFGGAVYYNDYCDSELNNSTFKDNAAIEDGGGICYQQHNSLSIFDCDFEDNSAGYGGAVYFDIDCSGTIEESLLTGNDAGEAGGAVYMSGSSVLVTDCSVSHNRATDGGGLYFADSPSARVVNCLIENNDALHLVITYEYLISDPNWDGDPNDPNAVAPLIAAPVDDPNFDPNDPNLTTVEHRDESGIARGGGIYSWSGPTLISDCRISGNTARTSGGGLYVADDMGFGLELKNCLVTSNSAGRDGGGISSNWHLEATISNCTITDNSLVRVSGFGGGLYCSYNSNVTVIDSIIWNNTGGNGSQVAVASGDPADPLLSTVTITYSDVQTAQRVDAADQSVSAPIGSIGGGDPNSPDYFRYSHFDTLADHNSAGSYGVEGWVGNDGISRIIHYSASPDSNSTNGFAYIDTVTIPAGTNPDSDPNNPYATGPVAPRTFTLEKTFDLGVSFGALSHESEFHVDTENNVIYLGASAGIRKYVWDYDTDNYVFDSTIAPESPVREAYHTQSLAYDPNTDTWYGGSISWEANDREVWKYEGAQGPNGVWELAFTYDGGGHHDGMEFVNGYLYLADYQGDYINQFTTDGTLVNTFYHEPLGHELEGMGWGALGHFWVGSHGNVISEFGGGVLQVVIGGGAIAGPPVYVESGCTLNGWEPADSNFFTWDINSWDPSTHNIDEDPNFTNGYYLSQPVALRDGYSPCVDAGSDLAGNVGMEVYTTKIDGVNDADVVDMGYHYSEGLTMHSLVVEIAENADDPGVHGHVDPNGGMFYEGDVVSLDAHPDPNYRVRSWSGTDDDSSSDSTNTVTVTGDKIVTVTFERIPEYTLNVSVIGGNGTFTIEPSRSSYLEGSIVTLTAIPDVNYYVDGWYADGGGLASVLRAINVVMDSDKSFTLRFGLPERTLVFGGGDALKDAIEASRSGDTIIVGEGTYNGNLNLDGREDVMITSAKPDLPDVISKTIIDCQSSGRAFTFNHGEDANTVLYGLTIRNGSVSGEGGGAIYLGFDTSVTLGNLVIENCSASNGDGGAIYIDGFNGSRITNVTTSGCSASGADGGAVFVGLYSTTSFASCTFADCTASSGFGGAVFCERDSLPVFTMCAFTGNSAGYDGGAIYYSADSQPVLNGCEFASNSADYGAGVYCGTGSVAEFDDCTFTGNKADFSGGGVYYGPNCVSQLTGCTFSDNSSAQTGGAVGYGALNSITVADSNFTGNSSGDGGALYFDPNCSGAIMETTLVHNKAELYGGAMNIARSDSLHVVDCNVSYNTALYGAGLYCSETPLMEIVGCEIKHNEAVGVRTWHEYFIPDPNFVPDPNDPNAPIPPVPAPVDDPNFSISDPNVIEITREDKSAIARGGGIYSFDGPLLIEDCQISDNSATSSGGGIYFVDGTAGRAVLRNCLLSNNSAISDGGGVSSNWHNELLITNCTLADNTVAGVGGGLYSSYKSTVEVVDSIIWRNVASGGAQIAVGSGDPAKPLASSVDITHSIVGPYFEGEPNAAGGTYVPVTPTSVLTVESTGDAEKLVSAILGPGITAKNLVFTGDANAAGTYTGGQAAGIGIEAGIILSSGNVALAPGSDPNQPGKNLSDGATGSLGLDGDPELSALIPGYTTYDATILEFDFISKGGDLFFSYVFASEEYNEFVNTSFNDIFAFFLDGRNIALIPGTTTPVSINNINGGNPFGEDAANPEIYKNNDTSDLAEGEDGFAFEYDGFTNVLTAESLNIGPGKHHIKLAIADAGDHVLDSSVFIRFGSFSDIRPFYPPVLVEAGSTLTGWQPAEPNDPLTWDSNSWTVESTVTGEDPCFVHGYYLSQIAAGQDYDSPALDAGSIMASEAGMDVKTTRTDGANDVNVVDIGYHYAEGLAEYRLTTIILGGHGMVEPASGSQYDGEVVALTAVPDEGYRVKSWSGTDDDLSTLHYNTVTMTEDKLVIVRFEQPDTIYVGGDPNAIHDAIKLAKEGDTLIVGAGTYYGDLNPDGKEITITSTNPDDANVVAATIIDCNGTNRGITFNSGEGPGTVIDGLTVINGSVTNQSGGGIFVGTGTSPTIRNVVVTHCAAIADTNATGVAYGYGGGIYVGTFANPLFVNVTVTDCNADEGGGVYCSEGSEPEFRHCTILGNSAPLGGGMYCHLTGIGLDVNDCNFTANTANYGAGVYFDANSSGTIFSAEISDNNAVDGGGGIYVTEANGVMVIDSNFVRNTSRQGGGIYVFESANVTITGSAIKFNGVPAIGFDLTDPNDANNFVIGQGGGVYSWGTPLLMSDCVIRSNMASTSGGGLYLGGDFGGPPQIINCLIADNSAGRDGGGVSVNWKAEPVMQNCTVVGNASPGLVGAVAGTTGFGGGLYCGYYSDMTILDSIFWNNSAVDGHEMAVATGFKFGLPWPSTLSVYYSDVKGGRSGVRVEPDCTLNWDSSNILLDPLFTVGPLGNYYLSQKAAGQSQDSPCVDLGSDDASVLGMTDYTTRTDEAFDKGRVDMGYHYRLSMMAEPCKLCDLVFDGTIDFKDFAALGLRWLEQGCSDGDDWCNGADFTFDGFVNTTDLAFLADCWLQQDTKTPTPNPSQWAVGPDCLSTGSIDMTAETAYDAWGWDVEYYFESSDSNYDSGWQSDAHYEIGGLVSGTELCFRVLTRDGMGLETAPSEVRCVVVDRCDVDLCENDTTPPTPAPYIKSISPNSPNSVVMIAQESSFESCGPIEYYFKNMTITDDSHDSGWQEEPNYTDVNLAADTQYCYRVKARDNSAHQNETALSDAVCVTTPPEGDHTAPTPPIMEWDRTVDANGFDGRPHLEYRGPLSWPWGYWAVMRADPNTTDPSGVEFYFKCITYSGYDSGWITFPAGPPFEYAVDVGTYDQDLLFTVRARDRSANHNQTGWAPEVSTLSGF